MAFLPLALALPVAGILLIALAGGRYARGIALGALVLGSGVTAAIVTILWSAGEPLTYLSGAWAPPIGIKLRADGLSAAMMVVTSLVVLAAALYAPSELPRDSPRA